MNNIEEFSTRWHVKIKKDSCGDEIIPGKPRKGESKRPEDCCHVYLSSGHFLAYLFMPTKSRMNSAARRLEVVGVKVYRQGEGDGIMAFDPEDEKQVKLLFRIARIRVKRQLTEEQKAKMKARFNK